MSALGQFGHDRRRRIYEYVERNGAVEPETVRRNVLVQPDTDSKPARSGETLGPAVPMPIETFDHHVAILERDGYLERDEDTLRIALPIDEETTTVDIDGLEAHVRPARQEDIAGIVGIIETIAARDGYVVAARLARQVTHEDVLLRHNESEDRIFFVATVDDEAVGWLHVDRVQSPAMGHTAELTLGVLEGYRGDGLGSALMGSGLGWAREHGVRKVYQSLPATNERAVAFLEDHDWTVESTRAGHYDIDDELVDEVQLAIWLDA